MKCPECGKENAAEATACRRCGGSLKIRETVCPRCGTPLESPSQKCPACSRGVMVSPAAEETFFPAASDHSLLRRLSPASMFIFSGGTGLVLGIILGGIVGAAGFLPALAASLPDFLNTLHGTLMGGIIYAVMGGLLGFGLLGVVGYLEAHLFNAISSISGGFRVTLNRSREAEEEEAREPF